AHSFPGTNPVIMVQGVDTIYACGNGDIYKFKQGDIDWVNLSSDATTTAPRNITYLVWHTNRLIAAGPQFKYASTDTTPTNDALCFSNLLDATVWADPDNGNNKQSVTLRIGGGDGQAITGLCAWSGFNLAAFKRHSVYVVNCDPTLPVVAFPIQLVHGSVGCVAARTAVQVGTDILFLADDGVRSLNTVAASDQQHELGTPLSFPVQDVINRINWTNADAACAFYWRNLYLLSVPLDGSTTNNALLIYNTLTSKWMGTWTNLPVSCFAIREANGISRLMLGLATTNKVIEYLDYVNETDATDSTYADYDGDTVLPRIKTRAFVFGEPISPKLGFGGEIEFNRSKGSLT